MTGLTDAQKKARRKAGSPASTGGQFGQMPRGTGPEVPVEGPMTAKTYTTANDFIQTELAEAVHAGDGVPDGFDCGELFARLQNMGLIVWKDGWVDREGGYNGDDPTQTGYCWLPSQGYAWATDEDGNPLDEDGARFWGVVANMLDEMSNESR